MIAATLLMAMASLALAQGPPPPPIAASGVEDRVGQWVPLDLELLDHAGRAVTLGELVADRPAALVLAWYRCPMLCGLVGQGLSQVRPQLADLDWAPLTISFDPTETPGDAAAARSRERADWPFLVGSPEAIGRLTAALGFRARKDRSGQWAHPSVLYVLTPKGRVAGQMPALKPDPGVLRRTLLQAGRGRIAATEPGWIDTCFRWDPALRAHGGQLMGLLRAGVALVAAGLFGLLLWLVRRP